MSMSEVDMSFHAQSTPLKAKLNVDEELPDILVNSQSNLTLEKVSGICWEMLHHRIFLKAN